MTSRSRRELLQIAGGASLVGLSGCLFIEDTTSDTGFDRLRSVPADQKPGPREPFDVDQPVPDGMEECVSIEGVERDPDDLMSKEDVAYETNPRNYQLCANCSFFCPSQTTDPFGACTEVEGAVASQHWCAIWDPARGLDFEPDPTSHDRSDS